MGTGAVTAQLPASPPVELGDEGKEPVRGSVDVGGQRGDFLLQGLKVVGFGL